MSDWPAGTEAVLLSVPSESVTLPLGVAAPLGGDAVADCHSRPLGRGVRGMVVMATTEFPLETLKLSLFVAWL